MIPDMNFFTAAVATQLCSWPITTTYWGNENVVYPNPPHPGLLPPHTHFSYLHKEELLARVRQRNQTSETHPTSPPHPMPCSQQIWVQFSSVCVSFKANTQISCCMYFFFLLYPWYVLLHYKGEWCHNTVGLLSVTYSISALIVSQQTYDVSCLGAFAEKGVFGILLTSISLLSCIFDTSLWPAWVLLFLFFFIVAYPHQALKVRFLSFSSINIHKSTHTDSTDTIKLIVLHGWSCCSTHHFSPDSNIPSKQQLAG